jgi:hypothetical protein
MQQIQVNLSKMDKKNVKLYVQMLAESLKALNETNEV